MCCLLCIVYTCHPYGSVRTNPLFSICAILPPARSGEARGYLIRSRGGHQRPVSWQAGCDGQLRCGVHVSLGGSGETLALWPSGEPGFASWEAACTGSWASSCRMGSGCMTGRWVLRSLGRGPGHSGAATRAGYPSSCAGAPPPATLLQLSAGAGTRQRS